MLCDKPHEIFKLEKFMRKDGKDKNGGGCMKDKDGRLVVSEKDHEKLWKDHMEKIMNVESVVVPIFKGKRDVMDFGAYRGVKLLEHAMKIVERVLEKRIRELLKIDDMQFGFMPGKGTTDTSFILRRMQEEFRGREKKLYMCFVDLEKSFDRVPRKVMEWALRKKSLPKVLMKQ